MKRAIGLTIAALALAGTAVPALAADLGVRRGPPPVVAPPVPVFTWSGLYIGGHIGGLWGDKDWTDVTPGFDPVALGTHDVDGFLGGGQVGFNWQIGALVIGAEAQFSWTNADGEHSLCGFGTVNAIDVTCRTELDWVTTATARIGYAFDRMLLYVKGGGAWASDNYTIFDTGGAFDHVSFEETRSGWTVGAGLEWAFDNNWSVKIEYNYLDFGNESYDLLPLGVNQVVDIDQQMHLVKAGINYRFNFGKAPGPVVARY